MKHLILFSLLFGIIACEYNQVSTPEISVDEVLNDWHKAAYAADADRYFGHFKDSTSIFMGTDATERWNVKEFKEYAIEPFSDGEGWHFTPFNRFISYSEDGRYAWFDEELDTPNLGLCRGSGVLENVEGEWKILHYNLALAIPNEVVYDVRDKISELKKEEN